ncbi:gamma-glutamyltranspeptidase 2 [Nannizzia gypsea CBS 118893]|uniref:Glutathione hydrolase n=1 Tax=Arthroderma gypseum (strain ATCC MYA-4604 / CBS 118893) TaxID=535722 RepID=E4UV14_ARTGP|nr:gamma-glutamyltranspeptidase 2 [Nannizzia gypsea CBS 118893]EFR01131.1 gamma-glutamyltranspeptidase 2 [Nannizzia gypsea CBS 118893]
MHFLFIFSAILQSASLVAGSAIPPGANGNNTTTQKARGISIASESQYCNEKAAELYNNNLEATAADAIIATVFCIGTVAMYHSGIGGGGFALVKHENGFEAIDFRTTAPGSATDEYYNNRSVHVGGASVGVPGELRGLRQIYKYAKLDWKMLFQPAIQAAKGDFKANDDLMYFVNRLVWDPLLKEEEDPRYPECGWFGQYPWYETFCPNGKLMQKGTPLNRTKYAETLEAIANSGDEGTFYNGTIADHTYETLRKRSSLMSKQDLQNYEAKIRQPASINYRGHTVTSTPIPTSGSIVLSILKILERFASKFNPGTDGPSTHWLLEALRYGYAQRSRLGDPDPKFHPNIDMAKYQEWLLNAESGFPHEANIKDKAQRDVLDYLVPYPGAAKVLSSSPSNDTVRYSGGTSHVVALDSDGLAISLTTSVGEWFGSRVMDPNTGIIFGDDISDFQRIQHPDNPLEFANNHIEGGKRPLSGMSPTIVTNAKGEVYFVTGSAGGTRIPSATLQTIVNVIDRGMSAVDAISSPRLHDQLNPNITEFDLSLTNDQRMYSKHIVKDMQDRNHLFTWVEPGFSSAQAIRQVPGKVPEASGEEWQSDSGGCIPKPLVATGKSDPLQYYLFNPIWRYSTVAIIRYRLLYNNTGISCGVGMPSIATEASRSHLSHHFQRLTQIGAG